jgi:hypothetical protein
MMAPLLRVGVAALALGGAAAVGLDAQDARDTLRLGIQAFDDFREEDAIVLLRQGLNPSGGERDSLWVAGLHYFVQLLLARGDDAQAATWLRWAWRHTPNLRIGDDAPPHVASVFSSARNEVAESTASDAVTETSWQWAPNADLMSPGTLRYTVHDRDTRPTVVVRGVGVVPPDAGLELSPGTYIVEASAEGCRTAEVTREVLPGVTTLLRFELEEINPGLIYVASEPWGLVYIDGERVGYTTVAAHPLRAGAHELRVERDGYVAFDTTFTIQRGQRLRLGTVTLRPRGRTP